MATNSSILGWKIPWTEEPGVLQSLRLQELDMAEHTYIVTHYSEGRNPRRSVRCLCKRL